MIRAPLHREPTTPWKDRGALGVVLAHTCFQCFAPLLEERLAGAVQALPWAKLLQPTEISLAQMGIVLATGLRLLPPISHEILRDLPPHLIIIDNAVDGGIQKSSLRDALNCLEVLGHKIIPLAEDHAVTVSAVTDCLAELHRRLAKPL